MTDHPGAQTAVAKARRGSCTEGWQLSERLPAKVRPGWYRQLELSQLCLQRRQPVGNADRCRFLARNSGHGGRDVRIFLLRAGR
jgi:hypothetical protein